MVLLFVVLIAQLYKNIYVMVAKGINREELKDIYAERRGQMVDSMAFDQQASSRMLIVILEITF